MAQQNPYLREIELIHVGRERARQTGSSAKASTVLVDVASPQQANFLIREGLILNYVHHEVELFHRDCQVTRCYRCQGLGHMAQVCRHNACCGWCASGWCASQEHTNDKECPRRVEKQRVRCANCKRDHPAWCDGMVTCVHLT